MGSIRTLADRGTLFIDFRYEGKRCREYTALNDSPANRKRLQKALEKIEQDIAAGTFVYEECFPGSKGPQRAQLAHASGPVVTPAAPVGLATPAFRDFADSWFKNHAVEWRRSHIKVLKSTLDGHLIPHFGNKPVGQIMKADILEFRTRLSKLPGRRDAGALSNKRINGILGPLKQMLTEAAELYAFPCQVTTLKPLKIKKSDVDPFTLDQVQTILATVRADYKDYFTVRLLTGLRTGEIHGLKWEYIDFDKRLILVRETFVLGEDEYTKTDGSQREIQMNQPVYDALKRQHEATSNISDYVFCNREGQPLDNKNFTDRVWYPLLRHLGLKLRTPYQTRHTAATLWLASGEAPEWIARQLGHTSTGMLFKTYSRFVPNLTRQDGSAFDRLLATRFSTGKTREDDGCKSDPSTRPPAQPPPVRRSMPAFA